MDAKPMASEKSAVRLLATSDSALSSTACSASSKDLSAYIRNKTFDIPPDAQVFYPTVSEFTDPLLYIERTVRSAGLRYGICKIIPPEGWDPPLAVRADSLKFKPCIQKLQELEATSRVKLNFLDHLYKYYTYTGRQILRECLRDKTVDLYVLYKIVEQEGGYAVVEQKKLWPAISRAMDYEKGHMVLKQIYENLLKDYATLDNLFKQFTRMMREQNGKEVTGEGIKSDESKHTQSDGSKDGVMTLTSESSKHPPKEKLDKELKNLTFSNPGPKITDPRCSVGLGTIPNNICVVCQKEIFTKSKLTCEKCKNCYHMHCLGLAMHCLAFLTLASAEIHRYCIICIHDAIDTPNSFGFADSDKEYTLMEFANMADAFKQKHFGLGRLSISPEEVEQEYWRILLSLNSDITVHHGADVHSKDCSSGFPIEGSLKKASNVDYSHYKEYVENPWNLNNIPILNDSVLRHIDADLSGMKTPWLYVGMCFSTLCWHNEDHWCYSIHYLHTGDPKTWYGVPGGDAEKFERVMRETAPNLFDKQPDLLHQLITTLNPNVLMENGVNVYHTIQKPGEFVVTFPRAYHAGFDHGYNITESVNFAPPDWIPIGRRCIDYYSNVRRTCVFSHDEVMFKIAENPDKLTPRFAAAVFEDLRIMVDAELKQRVPLRNLETSNVKYMKLEQFTDNERQCAVCNTTCFLSAVMCNCDPEHLACLRHFNNFCNCPITSRTLIVRYTSEQLTTTLIKFKTMINSSQMWKQKVNKILDLKGPRRVSVYTLIDVLNEGVQKGFEDEESFSKLSNVIQYAQDALAFDARKLLTGTMNIPKEEIATCVPAYYLKLSELPCVVPQEHWFRRFLSYYSYIKENALQFIRTKHCQVELSEIVKLLEKDLLWNFNTQETELLRLHLRQRKKSITEQ